MGKPGGVNPSAHNRAKGRKQADLNSRWGKEGSKVCHYCGLPLTRETATREHMLPVKQARKAGLPLPDVGPYVPPSGNVHLALKNELTRNSMWTPGRLRVLRLLSAPGSYATAGGRLVGAYYDGRMARLSSDMRLLLERHGCIEQVRAPRNSAAVFVWRITDKGRTVVDGHP